MDWLRRKRIRQIITYGWEDSAIIAKDSGKNRLKVFCDIIQCFRKYYVFSYQYKKNGLWKLDSQEFDSLASKLGEANLSHDRWVIERYRNHQFLSKWTQKKWENTSKGSLKRSEAYTKFFKTGKNLQVQYNVEIRSEHFIFGNISIGEDVLLAKNVFIDYTGELVMEDRVKLSDGVVIETHRHEFVPGAKVQKTIPTKLVIEEGVWIGQKALICEDVKRIGRFAQIGAGAVVRNPIPPYAIVVGNPAKIVGFLYTPEEVESFEKGRYTDDKKTDMEKYEKQYNKFFINNIAEIKNYLKN